MAKKVRIPFNVSIYHKLIITQIITGATSYLTDG